MVVFLAALNHLIIGLGEGFALQRPKLAGFIRQRLGPFLGHSAGRSQAFSRVESDGVME